MLGLPVLILAAL